MADLRQHRFVLTVSILESLILLSSIWCHVEGRGNYVPNSIIANRNTSVDPCNNFYDFVCGGWIKNNPVLESKSRNHFREVIEVIKERLKEILERDTTSEDNQVIKDARKFYQACLAVGSERDRNMNILLDRLAEWGGWPMASENWNRERFDWKKLMIHLIRTYDLAPFIRIGVQINPRNNSKNILMVEQAITTCTETAVLDDNEKRLPAWLKFVFKTANFVAKASNQTIPELAFQEDATMFLGIQNIVCWNQFLSVLDKDLYKFMSIKELQNMTDAQESSEEYPKINWLDLFRDFLEGTEVEIDGDVEVLVRSPQAVLNLIDLTFSKTNERTLANLMLWPLVANMLEEISPELRQLSYYFKKKALEVTKFVPRWETCVDETHSYFFHAIGYEYVKLYFDEDAKKNAEELVFNIRDSFIEELKEIDWMDGQTRAAAIEKAENLIVHVGYPEWYDNANITHFYSEYRYVIGNSHILNKENIVGSIFLQTAKSLVEENDREKWFSQVAVMNAFYNSAYNSISIPAGIFQSPFYVKGRPEALNYGAIGAIVGHEISHAFDIQGAKNDKFGNPADWWSSETLRTYKLKTNCFLDQYNHYPIHDKNNKKLPIHINGAQTLNENIADNGGIHQAYNAYLRFVNKYGREPRLPGLTHYSQQQLFYIGYATAWCDNRSRRSLLDFIEQDSHTPFKYRALIPLSNSKDFADAWQCRQNDETNTVKKCEFW